MCNGRCTSLCWVRSAVWGPWRGVCTPTRNAEPAPPRPPQAVSCQARVSYSAKLEAAVLEHCRARFHVQKMTRWCGSDRLRPLVRKSHPGPGHLLHHAKSRTARWPETRTGRGFQARGCPPSHLSDETGEWAHSCAHSPGGLVMHASACIPASCNRPYGRCALAGKCSAKPEWQSTASSGLKRYEGG